MGYVNFVAATSAENSKYTRTKLGFKLHPQKKRNFERSFYMGH